MRNARVADVMAQEADPDAAERTPLLETRRHRAEHLNRTEDDRYPTTPTFGD
jgi:hypothetical protein